MYVSRVFEFAWRIPLAFKIREGRGKWILRQVLYRHVPQELIERPKMGFGVPIDAWFARPEWAEALLDAGRLKRKGFFHTDAVRTKWKEHLSGVRNRQYVLWGVLMFRAWLDRRPPRFVGTTRALPTAFVRRNAHKALRWVLLPTHSVRPCLGDQGEAYDERAVGQDLLATEAIAAVHHVHMGGGVGEVQGLLDGGVAAAHDHDPLALVEEPIAGGAGRHPELR